MDYNSIDNWSGTKPYGTGAYAIKDGFVVQNKTTKVLHGVYVASDWTVIGICPPRLILEYFTPAIDGQTDFILSKPCDYEMKPILSVNGAVQEYKDDYTIHGVNLKWISTSFNLSTQDRINIYYSH